jgi:hypothetical protein
MRRVTFQSLWVDWTWRQIRGCPGRFVLLTSGRRIALADVVGEAEIRRYRVAGATDPVLVAALDGAGIIAYEHPDGSEVLPLPLCAARAISDSISRIWRTPWPI